jgi:hypothetical protein
MNVAMWLLIIAWGVLAVTTSIPWFTTMGTQVFGWLGHPGMLVIIGLHLGGAVLPLIAGVSQLLGKRLVANLSMTILAAAWLFWHIIMFTELAPVLRDARRLLLCVITLLFSVVYALQQARAAAPDAV